MTSGKFSETLNGCFDQISLHFYWSFSEKTCQDPWIATLEVLS